MVLTAPPHPQRPLDVNMDDKLAGARHRPASTSAGKLVDAIAPGRDLPPEDVLPRARARHDGVGGLHPHRRLPPPPQRRSQADERQVPDVALAARATSLVDDHEFKLEPNFTPGTYTVYFGLFVGDTRLKVKSGPNDGDNRINGGPLRVQ